MVLRYNRLPLALVAAEISDCTGDRKSCVAGLFSQFCSVCLPGERGLSCPSDFLTGRDMGS